MDITWPNSTCSQGLFGPECTFTPEEEGTFTVEFLSLMMTMLRLLISSPMKC